MRCRAAGCTRVFEEKASGAQRERPELKAALGYMRQGDTLVVWKLDRLARSLKQLIETVEALGLQGIGLRSLTEAIDTTTSGGKLVFHLFAALAEFERGVIRERTLAGLQAARARGRTGGRPPALEAKDIAAAKALLRDPEITVAEVAKAPGRRALDPLSPPAQGAHRGPGSPDQLSTAMPIKPELRYFYPIDWPQVSRWVRFVRAKGCCEACGRPHGQVVRHLGDGRWWDEVRQTWRDGRGREIPCPYLRRLESSRSGSTDGELSDDATSLPDAAEREGRLWIRHAEKTASPAPKIVSPPQAALGCSMTS